MMTREEALALWDQGPDAVVRMLMELSAEEDALQKRKDALQKRVEELKRQLAVLSRNSNNSSKPPSSNNV